MYKTLRGETFLFFHHHLHEILNPRKKNWVTKIYPMWNGPTSRFPYRHKKGKRYVFEVNKSNPKTQFQNTMVHSTFSKKNPWLFPGSNLVNARLYLAQKLKNLKDFISTKFNSCKFLDFGIKFCEDIISHYFPLSIEFLLFNFQKTK